MEKKVFISVFMCMSLFACGLFIMYFVVCNVFLNYVGTFILLIVICSLYLIITEKNKEIRIIIKRIIAIINHEVKK